MNGLARTRASLLGVALFLALFLLGLDRYAAYAHRPDADSTAIVLYTTTWCGYCERLRQDLRASGIAFTEYDVERSLDGWLGMWALRGRGVPVSVIGTQVVYGYQVPKIDAALRALGLSYLPANGIAVRTRLPSSLMQRGSGMPQTP